MRIAIVNLTGGGLSGGYRKYLRKLVPLLRINTGVTDLRVFVPQQAVNLLEVERELVIPWPARDQRKGSPWLRAEIRRLLPDVVFIPTAQWLDCGQIPVVSMIRNMEPLTVPFGGNPWQEGIKNLGRTYVAKKSCRNAVRVIAVSQYVKDFLCSKWGIEDGKVGTVYHGVETPPPKDFVQPPASVRVVGIERFLFTAGSIRPARGLDDLIHAFGHLGANGFEHKLVIAGGTDPTMEGYKRRLESMGARLDVSSRIIWAGSLSASEMSWCYRNCDLFIMTSRTEACPNIALEAMAHGCLCVSTEVIY